MHDRLGARPRGGSRGKFAALQVTGVGLLVALWLSGYGQMLLASDRFYTLPVIGAAALMGLWAAWRGQWADVEWLADILPVLGLVGTVTGFVIVAATADLSSGAGKTTLALHILFALVSNLGGICGYLWLTTTRKVCAG